MFRIKSIMNEDRDMIPVCNDFINKNENYYTIITGDNASGKSSLLSKAINYFLFKKNDEFENPVDLNFHSQKYPSKIIAICNAKFDKFTPNDIFNRLSNSKKNDIFPVKYINPGLNDNSRRGVARVVDQCIKHLILEHKPRSNEESHNINKAFEMFGLQPIFHLKFIINKNTLKDVIKQIYMMTYIVEGNFTTINFDDYDEKNNKNNHYHVNQALYEIKNKHELYQLEKIIYWMNGSEFNKNYIEGFYFDVASGKISSYRKTLFDQDEHLKSINNLLMLNIISVYDVQVMNTDSKKEISIVSLSSGQRTLLSHAVIISSFIEKNCMLCIDEPENSLHPEWQLNFMKFISLLCPNYLSSHLFIATHSPQIISGIPYNNGCVISLFRRKFSEANSYYYRRNKKATEAYELQDIVDYREQSADKQLTGIFKSPGYKNDFIIRKLLLILSKISKEIKISESDYFFMEEVRELISKKRIPTGDPAELLFKQIISFQKIGRHND